MLGTTVSPPYGMAIPKITENGNDTDSGTSKVDKCKQRLSPTGRAKREGWYAGHAWGFARRQHVQKEKPSGFLARLPYVQLLKPKVQIFSKKRKLDL